MKQPLVLELAEVRMSDVAAVGGKSASLGEMISQLASVGVRVPGGFATPALAGCAFFESWVMRRGV